MILSNQFKTYVDNIVISRLKSRIVKFNLFYISDKIENRERLPKSLAWFATLSEYDYNFPKLEYGWTQRISNCGKSN